MKKLIEALLARINQIKKTYALTDWAETIEQDAIERGNEYITNRWGY